MINTEHNQARKRNGKGGSPLAIDPIAVVAVETVAVETVAVETVETVATLDNVMSEAADDAKRAKLRADADAEGDRIITLAIGVKGPEGARLRAEVAEIIREEQARGNRGTDGARMVASWLYRHASASDDAVKRRAFKFAIYQSFHRMLKTGNAAGTRAMIDAHRGGASIAAANLQGAMVSQAGKDAADRRATIAGDKAAANAAAIAPIRPAFSQLLNLSDVCERKRGAWESGTGPRRDLDAAAGRVKSFLAAVSRLPDWTEAEREIAEEAAAIV